MHTRLRHTATALFCTLAATEPVLAQNKTAADSAASAAANACNPNAVPSLALAKATLTLQRAFQEVQAKRPAIADLKASIKNLTTPGPKKELGDSLGRTYYLGQAYILLLQEEGVKPIGRRGEYGIATDTLLTIDLLAAADTAITKIEHDWPQCAVEMTKWRQQKPWLDALNGSITALNAGKYDSAEVLAKRALLIDRSAPYAYSVLASVANNHKDFDAASDYLKQAMTAASKDTLYTENKVSIQFDMATTATLRAEAATGPDKKARVQEAVTAWQTFIPVGTRDAQVVSAEQTIVRLLKSVGDSANVAQAYAPLVADPGKYGEQALLNAGVIATRSKHPQDAAKLFTAVLDHNPNQRDAINNLAASYVGTKDQLRMIPLIDKLVVLDPNNSDNWLLYAYAYTGLLKGTKDPKLVKMYTDSLVKYNAKAEKLQTRVMFNEFSHLADKTTISGEVENRSATPKSYTLDVEFLDKSGAVVATQSAPVGPVPGKGGSVPFSISANGKNIVAFRYKPLP